MDVRKFRVTSRLSRMITKPGGITVQDALKRANEAVVAMRPPCIAEIDAVLAEIAAKFSRSASDREAQPLEALYSLASRIIDVSIALDGSDIDAAARALCELIDLSQTIGVCDWEAIDLHIDALKVLRAAGLAMTPAQRRLVLDGLARVTIKRLGDPKALSSDVLNA